MKFTFENNKKTLEHDLHDRCLIEDNNVYWKKNGLFHRVNGPSTGKEYLMYGKHHSLDTYSKIFGDAEWRVNGKLHKVNQIARMNSAKSQFCLYGKLYSKTTTSDFVAHYRNSIVHADSGPAVFFNDGTQYWYINKKLHREDGPAVIYSDGTQAWYINNKRHREDGPAIICPDGTQEYWIQGERKS